MGASAVAVASVIAAVQTSYDSWNSNGANSVAADRQSIANGFGNNVYDRSISTGRDNDTTRDSVAIGVDNWSSDQSIAVGVGNYVDDRSIAVGDANSVIKGGAVFGDYNTVYSGGSYAIGRFNESNSDDGDGSGNILIGYMNIAGDTNSDEYTENCILIGRENEGDFERNYVFGEGNIGQYQTVTLGIFAEPVSNASLIVGNGTGKASGQRNNGLVVMKNGDVIIPKAQGDISMGAYE